MKWQTTVVDVRIAAVGLTTITPDQTKSEAGKWT